MSETSDYAKWLQENYQKPPNPSACPKCGGEFQIYDWGVDGSTAWCYCQCSDEKCRFGWNEDFQAIGWYEEK